MEAKSSVRIAFRFIELDIPLGRIKICGFDPDATLLRTNLEKIASLPRGASPRSSAAWVGWQLE